MMQQQNQQKLVWLVLTFGISASEIARITGKSRPYVSRIMNGDSNLGSPEFYSVIERNLSQIISLRTKSLFETPVVSANELLPEPSTMPKCA